MIIIIDLHRIKVLWLVERGTGIERSLIKHFYMVQYKVPTKDFFLEESRVRRR